METRVTKKKYVQLCVMCMKGEPKGDLNNLKIFIKAEC